MPTLEEGAGSHGRRIAAGVGWCLLFVLLTAGSYRCSARSDDDDHHFHNGTETHPPVTSPFRLVDFRIEPARSADAHPVRRVFDIRGVTLADHHAGESGPADLRDFTLQVIEANEDLIGLPAGQGELVFEEVEVLQDATLVVFRHERHGGTLVVPGSRMVFRLDLLGNLVEIDVTIRLRSR